MHKEIFLGSGYYFLQAVNIFGLEHLPKLKCKLKQLLDFPLNCRSAKCKREFLSNHKVQGNKDEWKSSQKKYKLKENAKNYYMIEISFEPKTILL